MWEEGPIAWISSRSCNLLLPFLTNLHDSVGGCAPKTTAGDFDGSQAVGASESHGSTRRSRSRPIIVMVYVMVDFHRPYWCSRSKGSRWFSYNPMFFEASLVKRCFCFFFTRRYRFFSGAEGVARLGPKQTATNSATEEPTGRNKSQPFWFPMCCMLLQDPIPGPVAQALASCSKMDSSAFASTRYSRIALKNLGVQITTERSANCLFLEKKMDLGALLQGVATMGRWRSLPHPGGLCKKCPCESDLFDPCGEGFQIEP